MLKNASSKINVVAAALAIVSGVLVLFGNTVSAGNALSTAGLLAVASVAAAALCVVPAFVKNDIVALVAPLCAIALNMYVVNGIVYDRILMIAGLFSYDSMNTAGWNLFYVIIANAVVAILSCVALMVTGFMKEKK